MRKLSAQKMTPFLSPMLEDDPNATQKLSSEQNIQLRKRNLAKIQNSISMVAKFIPEGERAIAIKLTAFISTDFLVAFNGEWLL